MRRQPPAGPQRRPAWARLLLPLLAAALSALPAARADLNYTRSGVLYILANGAGGLSYPDASRYCDQTYGMTVVTYASNNEQTDVEGFFASALGTGSYWTGLIIPAGAPLAGPPAAVRRPRRPRRAGRPGAGAARSWRLPLRLPQVWAGPRAASSG
jgi:hypothetical protein